MKVTLKHGYFFRRSVNLVESTVRRGEIYYADLSPVVGSEQGGVRPVLIVQNDTGNRHSPTVIAAPAKRSCPRISSCPDRAAACPGTPLFCWSRSVPWIKNACGSGWAGWRRASCSKWTRPLPCPSACPMSVWYEGSLHTGQRHHKETSAGRHQVPCGCFLLFVGKYVLSGLRARYRAEGYTI